MWSGWVGKGVVRQAHQRRWVRFGGWVLLGPGPVRQAQGWPIQLTQDGLDAGMTGWGRSELRAARSESRGRGEGESGRA